MLRVVGDGHKSYLFPKGIFVLIVAYKPPGCKAGFWIFAPSFLRLQPLAEELGLDKKGGCILSYNGGKIVDCRTGETLVEKTLAPLMGADGEKWVLEEHINEMLSLCGELLEPQNGFLVLNLYSMGLSALLARSAVRQLVGACSAEQFGELYFTDPFGKALPLGVYYRCAR